MTEKSMRSASLSELRKLRNRGDVVVPENAPEEPSLGEAFWATAEIDQRSPPRSVHLKIDHDVFEFFRRGGKGHLTRMQNVLKAYVKAKRAARS